MQRIIPIDLHPVVGGSTGPMYDMLHFNRQEKIQADNTN